MSLYNYLRRLKKRRSAKERRTRQGVSAETQQWLIERAAAKRIRRSMR